jgi:hypothetical protein
MKLIKDDNSAFQGMSKEMLFECLETMEEVKTPSSAIMLAATLKETPKKRRAQKSLNLQMSSCSAIAHA